MHVQFRVNLGSIDAKLMHLDYTKCREGDTAEVSEIVGAKLVKSGIAIDVTPPPAVIEAPKPKNEPKPSVQAADISKPNK